MLQISSHRGKLFTLIVALDEKVGLHHYEVLDKSNTANTLPAFIHNLGQKLNGLNGQPAVLVMDNFSVHHSKKSQKFTNSSLI